uniref:aldehyde dehydrogenase (NAD(+)) n=1 Tax=Otolemur garnettii TaxID=30611 RepID=H0XZI9_OTOGA
LFQTMDALNGGMLFSSAYVMVVEVCVKILHYYAGWADKIQGRTIPADGNVFTYTRHEPIGVCGQINPWNYPLGAIIMKLAPALSCGNTVIVKPAEQTPLTALQVASLIKEVSLLSQNIHKNLSSFSATENYIVDKRLLSSVGMYVAWLEMNLNLKCSKLAKESMKRVSIKPLCGQLTAVLLYIKTLDNALEFAHRGVFFHQGQCCVAASRLFVEESIYDEFVKRSVELAKKYVLGNPLTPGVSQGPQIDKEQYDKILDLIESGKKEGAKLECGGGPWGNKGYFIQPTVFSNVTDEMRIAKEEIFGPVQQIMKFKSLDDVIKRANNTHYGLAAGVFTKDLDKAITVSSALQAGMVWVNCYMMMSSQCPFGGYKMSGNGREM